LTGNNFQLAPTPYSPNQMVGDFPFPLWNKPVFLSDSAVAIATTAKTIMFGNWNYYGLVERRGLTISRNPYLYQANGQIGIFCSVRFGGAVLQAEAFKYGIQG
jgi:HK97 family phage major capsid protein